MSQGAQDLDCGAYVDENIPGELISKSQILNNCSDISSKPAGKMFRPSKRNKTNLKEEADRVLPNEFVKLVDTRLIDGSFEGWFYDNILTRIGK